MLSAKLAVIFVCVLFLTAIQGWENLIGSEFHACAECVCHSRTGCYNRTRCASYQINMQMWEIAGKPTVGQNDDKNAPNAYAHCMINENCILNTIKKYTDSFDLRRNCDQEIDCRDRLVLFLYGTDYYRRSYSQDNVRRYNNCASKNNLPYLENQIPNLDQCVEVLPPVV